MKRFITLSILVIAFQVGFSKTISLDVILDYFPEAKEKGCVVVIENKESIDTLSFEKNNFKIDLELNSGYKKVQFIKAGYISKTILVNTSAKTNKNQNFLMEVKMIENINQDKSNLVVGVLRYELHCNAFVAEKGRFGTRNY